LTNMTERGSSTGCSIEPINIDTLVSEKNTTLDILQFTSSWQKKPAGKDNSDGSRAAVNPSPIGSSQINIVFTIPSSLSSQSILTKRVFISDVTKNQVLASLNNICSSKSSFTINYSTGKALPHNICLYLLLNGTLSTGLREIIFCRTIDDTDANKNKTSTTNNHDAGASHAVGPSAYFILSQSLMILIMMFFIYVVQTAREKSLVQRLSQRLSRKGPYKVFFGKKAMARLDGTDIDHAAANPASTLQAGLNNLAFTRNITSQANSQFKAPLEEPPSDGNGLPANINDRATGRPYGNRDLIDVKEFTRRRSLPGETIIDTDTNTQRSGL
jgi:hypothetical protein